MNPSMNFVPAFQQNGGPGFEHMASGASSGTGVEHGTREHHFSPYVDNGGYVLPPRHLPAFKEKERVESLLAVPGAPAGPARRTLLPPQKEPPD